MSLEDKLYKYLSIYKKMPDWLKIILASPSYFIPRKYLLGYKYSAFFNLAENYDYAELESIEEFQFLKLIQTIKDAYNYVDFYKETFDKYGINVNSIKDFDDFKKRIPFTHKEDIQNNPHKFISNKFPVKKRLYANTGGSTGNPLPIYMLKGHSRAAEHAHMDLLWSRVGYKMGDRFARLRGDFLGKYKEYSFDPWRNALILSSYAINNNNANEYLHLLKKYRVQFINAYPASLYNLIQLSSYKSYQFNSLKAIFLGSENIYPWQLEKFKNFFQINEIYYWYGHGELCALGGNCELTNDYHFLPTYSYVEFIIEDKIEKEDQKDKSLFEIVGTTFINPMMPLIRYRTKDFGKGEKSKCTNCGRNHKILNDIIGRKQEIAIGLNGEKITLTALIFGRHATYFNHVKKMQVVNKKPGYLIIRVVPSESFSLQHEKEIVKTLSQKEGMPFKVEVEKVNEIKTTNRGKHRFLIKEF